MRIVYIKETEGIDNIVKRIILRIKMYLNLIKIENKDGNILYCLPILKDTRISKYRAKIISNRINKLLEKSETNTVALTEYLNENQILKNYLYSNNINILNGRYLFKCLTHKILEYIFNLKKNELNLR